MPSAQVPSSILHRKGVRKNIAFSFSWLTVMGLKHQAEEDRQRPGALLGNDGEGVLANGRPEEIWSKLLGASL